MQRLNTKFVVVIAAFLAVAIGALGLVFVYKVMKDPRRNVEQGRELEKQGDFRGASKAYGRAVFKRRSNMEYMDLMRGATLKIVPETTDEARQQYETILSLLRQRARPNPADPEPWRELLAELTDRAHFLLMVPAWQSLYDAALDMQKSVPAGSEAERMALTSQGYAMAMADLDLPISDRERVEDGVRQVLEKDPKNEMAWEAYLSLITNDINRLNSANQQITAKSRQKVFDEALARADAAIPDSPVPSRARSRVVRSQLLRKEINADQALAQLRPIMDQLLAIASKPGASRRTVLNTSEQLLSLAEADRTASAVTLLDAWLQAHPDDLTARRLLSICLQSTDRSRALAIAKSIVDAPRRTVSLESAFREELRADATERIFDIEIGQADSAATPEEKATHLAAAKAARDQLADLAQNRSDEPRLLKADAKLAMLAGDYMTASTKLDRLLAVARTPDHEVYLLAADSAARRGEVGLTLTLLNRGIEQAGATYPLLLAKAQVELRLRRAADAIRTASAILAERPDDAVAAEILTRARDLQKVVSLEGSDDPIVKQLQETERLLGERNFDAARRNIDRLIKDNKADHRVLGQAARLELATGNEAKAVPLLDQALALSPNDGYLIQLRAVSGTKDALERVEKLAELLSTDEAQRPVSRYMLTVGLVANLKRDLAQGGRAPDGRRRDLAGLQQLLARAEASLPSKREAALAADPKSPGVTGAVFDEAILAGDYEKALAIGRDAEKSGNAVMGVFLQARALTLLRRFDEAIEVLDRAKQAGLSSAELARQLGETREAMGQISEAIAAYQDAFQRRPTDRVLLERYTELLRRSGDVKRALAIYREAAAASTGERSIISTWLRLEDLYGDRSQALCWRRKFYRDFPFDRDNAMALAVLLSSGKADSRLMVDDSCHPKYTEGEWIALPPAQRQTEVETMLKAHRTEAAEIFKSLLAGNPGDFEVALIQAESLARISLIAEGEKVLRDTIAKAPKDSIGPMWFALGQYLDRNGRTAEAMTAFAESQKFQDPTKRDGELALSDYWFDRNQWQRAYDALKPVIDSGAESVGSVAYRRMAEICQRLRKFEEGKQALQRGRSEASAQQNDAQYELLAGGLELGQGEDAWSAGKKEDAERFFESGIASLRKATQLQPGSTLPWIALASALRDRYTRTGDTKALDQALTYADKSISITGGYFPAVRLKSELQLDKEDMEGSIRTVERYLELVPESIEGRRLLAERHLRNGNLTRALQVLAEGAMLSPNEAIWYQAIGELESRRGNSPDAIRALDRALQISPSPESLQRALEQRLRQASPDWPGIVELSRKYPDEVRRGAAPQSILAAALVQSGDRENGMEALRRAGRFVRSEMEAGRATSADLDVWYRAVREVFSRPRTGELDAFVTELLANKLGPEDLRWLAGLWSETGKEGEPNARKYLERAMPSMDSMDARFRSRVWLTAGNLAFLRDDCNGAVDAFEKAVQEDPDDSMSLNNLAYLLGSCKQDIPRALEMARRAVRINPTQPFYLDTLGMLLIKNGEAEAALAPLRRSAILQPMASNLLHLAQALKATGKADEAKQALDKAETLGPDADTAAEIKSFRATLG